MITGDVKIAHISDLHISGMQDRRQLDCLSRLFDHFNTAGYDHLVISGDLSNSASSGDWKIIRNKLESHGFYHWDKTTLIPGNHDLILLEEEMRFYNALNPLQQLRNKAFERRIVECLGHRQTSRRGVDCGRKNRIGHYYTNSEKLCEAALRFLRIGETQPASFFTKMNSCHS